MSPAAETTRLRITGMSCGGCVGGVRDALQAVMGVSSAEVTLDPPLATVRGTAGTDALVAAVTAAGKGVSVWAAETRLRIGGMSCGGCVGGVRKALEGVEGVEGVEVILEPPMATVRGAVGVEALVAAVQKAGKDASAWVEDEPVVAV
jgi:copper chaperone CopZ